MKLAIVGPGAIGSTFAYYLSKAGHEVTVVARGQRLQALQRAHAIEGTDGSRAAVNVVTELAPDVVWDLVLVTVLAPQVEAVLPALRSSAARKVMFMFNTFESLSPLREAVGADRFAFGFPGGVLAFLRDSKLEAQVRSGTTVDSPELAELFTEAGVPTVVEKDMHSWLRSHAALVVPLMALGVLAHTGGHGVSWPQAALHARAFRSGFELVRACGNPLLPRALAMLARLPTCVFTPLFWCLSRTKLLRDLGSLGPGEARMLIDMMHREAPDYSGPLRAIRP